MAATPSPATPWANANVQAATHASETAAQWTSAKYRSLADGTWYQFPNSTDVRLAIRRASANTSAGTIEVHRPGSYDGTVVENREYDALPAYNANTDADIIVLGPFPRQFYGDILYFRNGNSAPAAANAFGVLVITA